MKVPGAVFGGHGVPAHNQGGMELGGCSCMWCDGAAGTPHGHQLRWGLVPTWQAFARVTACPGTTAVTWWPQTGPLQGAGASLVSQKALGVCHSFLIRPSYRLGDIFLPSVKRGRVIMLSVAT